MTTKAPKPRGQWTSGAFALLNCKSRARAMLAELKGRALLDGVRGSLPKDTDALVEILIRVSRLAIELEDLIQEMDINPLIVQARGEGAVAADALFVPAVQR